MQRRNNLVILVIRHCVPENEKDKLLEEKLFPVCFVYPRITSPSTRITKLKDSLSEEDGAGYFDEE